MKPFAAQTYYELLEISVSATAAEIRAACDRLTRLYADDQLALYGLAQPGSAQNLRARLKEAMEILTDDELRSVYDEDLGLPPREKEPVVAQIEMGELLHESDRPVPRASRPAFAEAPPPEPPEPPAPVAAAPVEVPAAPAAEPPPPEEVSLATLPPAPGPSAPRPSAPPLPEAERPKLPEITPDTEYNGEFLRSVRNAHGLSLAVVADRTRIGAKHLQNVEADRYDALPATVYLRGILMNLARELKLDGLKVCKSYLGLVERGRSKG